MSDIKDTTEWGIINKLEAQYIEKTLKIELRMNKFSIQPQWTPEQDATCECDNDSCDVCEWFLLQSKRYRLQKAYNKIQDLEKQAIAERSKKLCFYTISPRPEVKLQEFQETMGRFLKKKYLQEVDVLWCYEQRGETLHEAGKGLHAHILFKKPMGKNTQPSMLQNEAFNTFKGLYKLSSKKHEEAIKTSAYKTYIMKYYPEKIDYMKGNKYINAEDKQAKLPIDEIFREINALEPLYTQKAGTTFQEPTILSGECHGFCSCGVCALCHPLGA